MDIHNITCEQIQACVSYENCTGSAYIPGWTDKCCQPEEVKHEAACTDISRNKN